MPKNKNDMEFYKMPLNPPKQEWEIVETTTTTGSKNGDISIRHVVTTRTRVLYWIELYKVICLGFPCWVWQIRCINGTVGPVSRAYSNKAQCRNAATSFAKYAGLEVREDK